VIRSEGDIPQIVKNRRRSQPGANIDIMHRAGLGKPQVKILSDGWTAVTRDRSLSAQFEHSVGVTATSVEIFTLSQRHGEKPLTAT
jgi:methionyl aminopeptidase